MAIWVNIEQSDGTRYGDGPLTGVVSWTSKDSLDAAGSFSFEFPAGNARSGLCQSGRYVRGWRVDDDGAVIEVGYGIIDHVGRRIAEDGAHMLVVSGVCILGELGTRSVLGLAIETVVETTSQRMAMWQGVLDTVDIWTVYEPADFPYTLIFGYSDIVGQFNKFYVSHTESFEAVYLDLDMFMLVDSGRLNGEWWNEETEAWEQLNINSDGTEVDGNTMKQAGWIEFEPPGLWGTTTADGGDSLYYVRFFVGVVLDDTVRLTDVKVRTRTPRDKAYVLEGASADGIMDFAPAGWTVTGSEVDKDQLEYYTDQTVLSALRKIVDNTGGHFRRGDGRELVWIKKTDTPDTSTVRAVYLPDPTPALDNDAICLIVGVDEEIDTFRRITRIYPHGGGTGDERPSLADCTRTPAAGYTLDTANNCIIHDASDAAGRVDGVMAWSDIISLSTSPTQREYASNQLYDRAVEYLSERHDVEQFYTIRVVKVNGTILPGNLLHVVAYVQPDTQQVLDIDTIRDDSPFWVTDVETTISADGSRLVTLSVGTIDRRPDDDVSEIAHEVEQARIARAQNSVTTGALSRWISRGATGQSSYTSNYEGGTNATMAQGHGIDATYPTDLYAMVWQDTSSLWTPTNIALISPATFGWGNLAQRSLILGLDENALALYDETHRAVARLAQEGAEYFRFGLPDGPAFYWNQGTHLPVIDGELTRLHSITADKMMLAPSPYNFLAYNELRMGDPSVYQSCEMHERGLTVWGLANISIAEANDILNLWPGILWHPVYYLQEEGYGYEEEYRKKLAFEGNGLNLWGHGAATAYRVGDLDNLRTMARYGPTGFLLNGYQYENDSVHFFFESTAEQCRASMFFYREGYDSLLMEWEDTGWTVSHADKDVMHVDQNGVKIRDYLAFHIDSVDPTDPPAGALVYDRTEDYYKFYNGSGAWRRLSDEAI